MKNNMWNSLKNWFNLLSFIISDRVISDRKLKSDGWVWNISQFTHQQEWCYMPYRNEFGYMFYLIPVYNDSKKTTYELSFNDGRLDTPNISFKIHDSYELYKVIGSFAEYTNR